MHAHLIPYFTGLHLHEITSKRIEDYKGMRAKQVNPASVNRETCFLKTLFRKATEWGKVEENPAKEIKTLKEIPQTPRLLEVEEVAHLLEACQEEPCTADLYVLVCCMVYAGLRKAEVFNLRWNGIDWKRDELTVESRAEWQTKNYESRSIPMNETLITSGAS